VSPVLAANLTIRFLLELCLLAALAYWGTQTGEGFVSVLLSIAAPVLAAWVWGTFVAAKAPRRLKGFWWFAIQAVLFGAAVVALASLDHTVLAAAFALAVALNLALLYAFYSTPS
jgi:quinol-cytochrome oxidoreductase complex cytochrome b subunit